MLQKEQRKTKFYLRKKIWNSGNGTLVPYQTRNGPR